jgi:glycerophosphoryl diester phosphodiesterase
MGLFFKLSIFGFILFVSGLIVWFFFFATYFCGNGSTLRAEKVLVVGHRGACGHAPENTMASIKKALDLGVDMFEIDVCCCKSSGLLDRLVVIHDETLDRTTNGTGFVSNYFLDELKKFDAGDGEQIPTMAEVFDFLIQRKSTGKNSNAKINIELKGDGTGMHAARLVEWCAQNKGLNYDDVVVTSFKQKELLNFVDNCKNVKIGEILGIEKGIGCFFGLDCFFDFYLKNISYLVLPEIAINSYLVNRMHNQGVKVFVYTINSKNSIIRMKECGVDGIISDYPDKIQSIS